MSTISRRSLLGLETLLGTAIKRERDACAKLARAMDCARGYDWGASPSEVAEAIEARPDPNEFARQIIPEEIE